MKYVLKCGSKNNFVGPHMMLRRWMHDFFFTTRIPLMWELWLLVAIKLAGLYLLWFLFFSAPIGPSLTEAHVAAHLVEH